MGGAHYAMNEWMGSLVRGCRRDMRARDEIGATKFRSLLTGRVSNGD